jgi:hypothetical protein
MPEVDFLLEPVCSNYGEVNGMDVEVVQEYDFEGLSYHSAEAAAAVFDADDMEILKQAGSEKFMTRLQDLDWNDDEVDAILNEEDDDEDEFETNGKVGEGGEEEKKEEEEEDSWGDLDKEIEGALEVEMITHKRQKLK